MRVYRTWQLMLPRIERHFCGQATEVSCCLDCFEYDGYVQVPDRLFRSNHSWLTVPPHYSQVIGLGAQFVTKKTIGDVDILKDVTGYVMPGTMTLILGGPGSGKSTLQSLLAGMPHKDKTTTIKGEVRGAFSNASLLVYG